MAKSHAWTIHERTSVFHQTWKKSFKLMIKGLSVTHYDNIIIITVIISIFTGRSGEWNVIGSLVWNFWECFWMKVKSAKRCYFLPLCFLPFQRAMHRSWLELCSRFFFGTIFYLEGQRPYVRSIKMNIRSWGPLTHSGLSISNFLILEGEMNIFYGFNQCYLGISVVCNGIYFNRQIYYMKKDF